MASVSFYFEFLLTNIDTALGRRLNMVWTVLALRDLLMEPLRVFGLSKFNFPAADLLGCRVFHTHGEQDDAAGETAVLSDPVLIIWSEEVIAVSVCWGIYTESGKE